MDTTFKSPAILSTVTGRRGIERGLERAFLRLGWPTPKTVAYVEIEAFACWNLVKQMEQGVLAPAPIWSDLKTFRWEIFRGNIDFITGGYPCQPFSLAGKQKGVNDPRHLWPYYETGIETIKPVGCFFENVRNHLNIGYREVKQSLENLGYEVRQGIYSAEEVGASHRRERLFILALDHTRCGRYYPKKQEIQAGRGSAQLSGTTMANPISSGLQIRREQNAQYKFQAAKRSSEPTL